MSSTAPQDEALPPIETLLRRQAAALKAERNYRAGTVPALVELAVRERNPMQRVQARAGPAGR